jgi:hypothetical protein
MLLSLLRKVGKSSRSRRPPLNPFQRRGTSNDVKFPLLRRGTKGVGKEVTFTRQLYPNLHYRDTGIGIPADRIEKIFDRFYQVDGSHTREHEGTGIGLSLTKELVELHKGKIEVESEPGKGSTFTVSLPLGKDHLRLEEICEPDEVKADENEPRQRREYEKEMKSETD